LFLALNSKNPALVDAILQRGANPELVSVQHRYLTPLHQAVALDFADGIRSLARFGARLTDVNADEETALTMAARLQHLDALSALLQQPMIAEDLQQNTSAGIEAIRNFALQLEKGADDPKALKGIAMLLAHGADIPEDFQVRAVLIQTKASWLAEMRVYLSQNSPGLAKSFVQRCHLHASPLHKIIYAHSWWDSIRYFVGKPCDDAIQVESCLDNSFQGDHDKDSMYALFVKEYIKDYSENIFSNPWSSTMLWEITEGHANWDMVQDYASRYPMSRTARIVDKLSARQIEFHANISDLGSSN
jgi:hypothetical protein